MSTSLAQLTTRCQSESDNTNSEFVASTGSPSEWTNYINSALAEVYGLTATVYGADYYVQSPLTGYLFTTDGINQFFSLPADFFKLLGVDVLYGAQNQWVGLKPFAFGDRNKFNAVNSPIPAAGQQCRVFYIPRYTPLVNAGDLIPDALSANGWDEYIVVDACIRTLAKEESDVSVFMARKKAIIARLDAEAANRDAGSPASIVDSRSRGVPGISYRINGNSLWLIGFQLGAWPGGDWDIYGGSNSPWSW